VSNADRETPDAGSFWARDLEEIAADRTQESCSRLKCCVVPSIGGVSRWVVPTSALRGVRGANEAVDVLIEARVRERLETGGSDVELLVTLAAVNGRMRRADIDDANGISRSGATHTMDRLEKLGLVTRVAVQDDRRSTREARAGRRPATVARP
jgi:hypothetical protein